MVHALIHRQLRADTEKALARTSKIRRRLESPYPVSQKSAKVPHDAIAILDKVIKRFDSKNEDPFQSRRQIHLPVFRSHRCNYQRRKRQNYP